MTWEVDIDRNVSIKEFHGISTQAHVILVIINVIIIVFGLTGNSVVLYGSLRYNVLKLDRITTVFLENIAVSDMLIVVLRYIPMLTVLLGDTWVLGDSLCWVLGNYSNLPLFNEIMVTSLLSSYRLYVLKLPKTARQSVRVMYAKVVIFVLILLSICETSYQHVFPDVNTYFDPRALACATNVYKEHLLVTRFFILPFQGLPMICLMISNTVLLVILVRSARKTKKQSNKAVATVAIISTIFLMSYVPLGVRVSIRSTSYHGNMIYIFGYIASLNLLFNPVVYYIVNIKFRRFVRGSIMSFTKHNETSEEMQKMNGDS